MLDDSLIAQLKDHFSTLQSELTLVLQPSHDAKQVELRELLLQVASASPKIHVVEQGKATDAVQFELLKDGAPTGVRFRGIPGGHEFTSLVLALLNADGKGKLPDEAIRLRVQALRGPIEIRTFVSLSCTNCPDVVQALNQMALLHGSFTHEMVDGALAADEVTRLGVQAVPSVFVGDKLIHVGKSTLGELLDVVEGHFGHGESAQTTRAAPAPRDFDLLVVGGGPAEAAAIYSARKGLKTGLVTQKIGGQVRETLGIENLISVPYTEGLKLAADLEKHLRAYPVEILEDRRVESLRPGETHELHLKGGEVLRAKSVILATGAKWRELGIPGEKEHLGRGVAFCPHCDGPFYKGKRVAVVGGGNSGVEAAIDLAGICSHVTLFEFLDQLKADEILVRKLRSLPNVEVLTGARTTEIVGGASGVTALHYQDRATEQNRGFALDGVFVQIGLSPNSALAKDLVDLNRFGEIVVDDRGRTSAKGIYAAGDVTTVPFKQIVIAMGEGAKAALTAFEDRMRARCPGDTVSPQEIEERLERLKSSLRSAGVRQTSQRLAIYREVLSCGDHPDVDSVHQNVKKLLPDVSLDTVYRTLWMLSELGLLATLGPRQARARFDANTQPHHHFVCTQCGGMQDFQSVALSLLGVPEEAAALGEAVSMHVEVHGTCVGCVGRSRERPNAALGAPNARPSVSGASARAASGGIR